MLNHIWFWMIVGSLLIALGKDIYHEITLPDNKDNTERILSKDTSLGQVTDLRISVRAGESGSDDAVRRQSGALLPLSA